MTGWGYESRPRRAVDLCFTVRTTDPELGAWIEEILSGLPVVERAEHHYELADSGDTRSARRFVVRFDDDELLSTLFPSLALSHLLWHINRSVVDHSGRTLLLHAAAAVRNGIAVILPAPMESGKTTMVAGLVQRGFGYLTDEAAAIDPETGLIEPYAKALSIDPGSWNVLADLAPELPPHLAEFSAKQWHIPVTGIRSDAVAGPSPVRLIVAPRYESGAKTRLEQSSRALTLALLAKCAFNLADHGRPGFDLLGELVRQSQCYTLTIGDLDHACALVEEAFEELEVVYR